MASQIVLALFGSVLLGVALVALGLRGRRINRHPVCSLCGFDLEGTYPQSITCPECGAGLRRRKGVRIGARRKMWIVASVGALLVLLPAGVLGTLLYAVLTGADVNRYKPVGLLLWEARRANAVTAEAAVGELHSRVQNKQVSAEVVDRIVAVALDVQEDLEKPWLTGWGDIVETARVTGDVDDDTYQRFIEQAAVVEFIIREQVRLGDPVPVEVKLVESRVGSASQLHVMAEWMKRSIDGENARPLEEPFVPAVGLTGLVAGFIGVNTATSHAGYFNISGPRGAWGGWSYGDCRGTLRMPADLEPGPHTAELTLKLQAQLPPRGGAGTWTPLTGKSAGRAERKATLAFVVTPEGQETVRLVEPPAEMAAAFAEQLRTTATLHVQKVGGDGFFAQSYDWGHLYFNAVEAPMDGAFVVKLRLGETTTGPLGELVFRAPDPNEAASSANPYRFMATQQSVSFQMPVDFKEETVTIVLEPSRRGALKTVDLKEIYGEAIELKDVAVQRPVR